MAQQIYFTAQAPGMGIGLPPAVHVPAAISGNGQTAGMRGLGQLADAGGKLLGAYLGYQDRKQNCIVEDAWQEAQVAMREWRTEYDKTHKAGDARDAQAAYNAKWAEIAKDVNDKYGDELSDRHKHLLGRKMELGRLYADEDGAKYQEQQFNIWGRNQLENAISQLDADIAADPGNVDRRKMGLLEVKNQWEQLHPGEDSTAFMREQNERSLVSAFEGYRASGDLEGAQRILDASSGRVRGASMPGGIGSAIAQFESGSQGAEAIGYDRTGGTSYGRFQLSSRAGSYREWLDYLDALGGEAAAMGQRLRAAGNADTGSSRGRHVDAYLKEVRANRELVERTQKESITSHNLEPALRKLPKELRETVEADPALMEMAFSTAVQHGGSGGGSILAKAWSPGMSRQDYINAVYDERGRHFGSSTKEVQESVRRRFRDERKLILGMGGAPNAGQPDSGQSGTGGRGPDPGQINPVLKLKLQGQLDADLKQRQELQTIQFAEDMCAQTADMSIEERNAHVRNQVAQIADPRTREKVNSLALAQVKMMDERYKANIVFQTSSLLKEGENDDPLTFAKRVEESGLPKEAQKKALETFRGDIKENELNRRALTELRIMIDEAERNGKRMTEEQIGAFAYNRGLTDSQTNSALKYLSEGGNTAQIRQSAVNEAYKYHMGLKQERVTDKDVPLWLLPAIEKEWSDPRNAGKTLTPTIMRGLVGRAIMTGTVAGGWYGRTDTTRGQALLDGKMDSFREDAKR